MKFRFLYVFTLIMMVGCMQKFTDSNITKLIVIDPQHFHAALVQKYTHPTIDSTVQLFAQREEDVVGYNTLISQFKTRDNQPTNWETKFYYDSDFVSKAFTNTDGNLIILAGDNKKKISYIESANAQGLDVFADKPLVIDKDGYANLETLLHQRKGLIYDIMTERYDVKNELIKALILDESFSGGFENNATVPLISFSSTHHIIKNVSGKPLIRPILFFNTNQQGEGLVDVTTHYIDLVQWMLSSEKVIEIKRDVKFKNSKRWKTSVSKDQFSKATNLTEFPNELLPFVKDDNLELFCNGKIDYLFKDVPVSINVQWNVESLDGKGDQFYAKFQTRNLNIEVKPNDMGKSTIYVSPIHADKSFGKKMKEALSRSHRFAAVDFIENANSFQLIIPSELYLSHEDHFAKVLKQFLNYRKNRKIPDWETSFLLAKYYLTTEALANAETYSF
ncbi:putative oxidoreductase C-terminal domain-containing protein [Sphingobacterium bovistauri]|uniref:Putative oxidoreductase C-terminal domain-containing protein n=1 Tax=Sphingobacterium bovistauri TaxID=2781959 RepID=A0ABS7Z5V4_9SPHI|nr:putative oxidoreductase C-terminal domain-containing protein [Sphingobacterium bovistauri]MCA5005573.1 hypothetical protein [Sphingobacterium bovistauri]